MAKIKQNIVIEHTGFGGLLVYCDPDVAAEIKKMSAIHFCIKLNGDCYTVTVSPRYDLDEVIAEIKQMDTPIPSAFLPPDTSNS